MELISKNTFPQIVLLRGAENLTEWDTSVHDAVKFYGLQEILLPRDPLMRKRPRQEHGGFMLGLLTASVSLVADRLSQAGWDFTKAEGDPRELYDLVLNFIVPASSLPSAVATILRKFAICPPVRWGLTTYRRSIGDHKRRFDIIGCPLNDKIAVCLVIDAMKHYHADFQQQLIEDMTEGILTWNKLMNKIEAYIESRRG